jgi:AcrR family transcriptional regulator
MAAAEAETHDPAEQLVAFVRRFEQVAVELAPTQPGCLFVSFIHESQLAGDGSRDLIAGSIRDWRERLLEKLEAAARVHPPATAVDLPSLADHVFTVFEGGFILTLAMHEPAHLPAQLAHVRHYLELLFGLSPGQPARGRRRAAIA